MKTRASGVALVGLLVVAATAWAQSASVYNKYKGQIVINGSEIAMTDDDKATLKALKGASSALTKREGSSKYPFHFVAFLNKKAGTSDLSLLFYEKGKKEMRF